MSPKGLDDDENKKQSVKDKKLAFEEKSKNLSSSSRKPPTAGTDSDSVLAGRVDERAVRKTAGVFGSQQTHYRQDQHQDAVKSEADNAKELGMTLEEYREQMKEQRKLDNEKQKAAKSDAEKAEELGMSEEEYHEQVEAMNRYKKK